jgi:hypothetical protein
MLKLISALGLFLVSCAGSDDQYEPEIGTLSQALTHPFGYGMEGGQEECISPWSGGKCFVPKSKAFIVRLQTSTCPVEWRSHIEEVVTWWAEDLNARGWLIGIVGDGVNLFHSQVRCRSNTDPGPWAQTVVSSTTCSSTIYGQRCKFERSEVNLYPGRLSLFPGWSTATSVQRQNFFRNMTAHEQGHVVALGHKCNEGSELMCGFALNDISIWWNNRLWFTPVEFQRAEDYVP